MSHEFSTVQDQSEANEAILAQSELGIILKDAYIAATNVDPRLNDIAIVPVTDPEDKRPASIKPSWDPNNQTGRHEIYIRLGNLDETLATFKQSMEHTPKNTAIVAESLGLRAEEVTPQLLFVYSTLHEMGHALECMDYEAAGKTPAEHLHDQRVERAKLPIGNLLASQLLSEDSANRQYVERRWEEASQMASENIRNSPAKKRTFLLLQSSSTRPRMFTAKPNLKPLPTALPRLCCRWSHSCLHS